MLKQLDKANLHVDLLPAEEAEVDEMWSFVKKKSNQRWLWHAIDHASGKVLAYVFGARKDKIFSQLKALLMPFGIKHFYTDDWGLMKEIYPAHSTRLAKLIPKKLNENI